MHAESSKEPLFLKLPKLYFNFKNIIEKNLGCSLRCIVELCKISTRNTLFLENTQK
jgi:hypothetical protein